MIEHEQTMATWLDMNDYTPKAKVYWGTTVLLGLAVLGLAVVQVATLDAPALLQVLGGVALAAITGVFPVRLPGRKTSIAGAEIFVFLLLLLYGPSAATLAAAGEAAVGSYRTSKRLTSRLGSPAMAALAMYGCGSAYTLSIGALGGLGVTGPGAMFGALLVAALAYFAAGTLLMESMLSLKRGEPVRALALLWDDNWLALAFAASASIAGLLYVTHGKFGTTVLVIAMPIIAMFLSTVHLFFRQAEADERAAAETARHLAELRASEARFHSAFTHAAVGMVLVARDGRILQTNAALCQQLGRVADTLVGRELGEIVHADDIEMLRTEVGALLCAATTQFATELRCLSGAGDAVWVAANGALFSAEDASEQCLILQLQDVTARKHAEAQLHHIAYHDDLTNLPNRSYFQGELARVVAAAVRDASAGFAVMFLDFDRFKTINDSLGHAAGDELLTTAAQRLKKCVRPTDVVARLGGDEFAILLEGIRADGEVVALAQRILRSLGEPLLLAGTEVATSASIGITTSALRYLVPEDVMRDADIAMYKAKGQGRARYALFDSALHDEVFSQLWMEGELRRALAEHHFTVEFQPIFDLRTQRLYGFEALARWPHPERGNIAPDQFVPVAEDTGHIIPLGHRILEIACMHLARWRRKLPGADNLRVHVNVSPAQLEQPGSAAQALQIMKTAGVPCDRMTLEVTEGILVDRYKEALPNLRQLRDLGVTISIDDFGTGYSSLSMLQDLPIDEFKIDRTFVNRVATGKGEAVVNAILALGQTMGKDVIVEGIETAAQLEQLLQLGCKRGQGYLLGRPLSADYAENLAREAAPAMRVAHLRPVAVA